MARRNQRNQRGSNTTSQGDKSITNRNSNAKKLKPGKEMEVNVKDSSINAADIPKTMAGQQQKAFNDPTWYTHYRAQADDVGSLSFASYTGLPYNVVAKTAVTQKIQWTEGPESTPFVDAVAPGLLTFDVIPVCGISQDATSAVNVAAQQLYTLDRKANSGAVNYDKTDVIMLVLAMDSAYCLLEHYVRLYRVVDRYLVENRYYPDVIVQALGYDLTEVTANFANFRYLLDNFVSKLGSIDIPAQFDFIKRHSWMFSNIYTDSPGYRGQSYMYKLAGLYQFAEATDSTSLTYLKFRSLAQLEQRNITPKPDFITRVTNAINAIMTPLLGSADVGTISGDLRKAFGESGMIKLATMANYETLTPEYVPEVIEQMANGRFPNLTDSIEDSFDESMNITQDMMDTASGPQIKWQPYINIVNFGVLSATKNLLNYRMLENSVDNNFVATRLMSVWSDTEASSGKGKVVSCGTELCFNPVVWSYTTNNQQTLSGVSSTVIQQFEIINGINPALKVLNQQAVLSKFDNHFSQFMFTSNGTATGYDCKYVGAFVDLNNYKWLSDEEVANLHATANMSLFYVKDYGLI